MGLFDLLFRRKKKKRETLGWRMDQPDFRDYRFGEHFHEQANKGRVDLHSLMPPIVDQGSLGTCVPCSLSAMISYLVIKEFGIELSKRSKRGMLIPLDDSMSGWIGDYFSDPEGGLRMDVPKPGPVLFMPSVLDDRRFSRLFIYYEGRRVERRTDEDSGMELRSGLKALAKYGVCLEADWPYETGRYAWKPPKAAYKKAKRFRVRKYWRLSGLEDIKDSLDQGYPVAMGMTLYDRSWSKAESSGMLLVPGTDERRIGGHCVLIVGYDDSECKLLCRNSMGMDWGVNGYFNMPQDYVQRPGLTGDLWTVR